MQDIPAIAAVAHARDAIVLMDNTWATPLFFPPHARGVDIAIEAGTKYLGGASDLLLGLVSANERCWQAAARDLRLDFAMCAGPEDVFLGAARPAHAWSVRLRAAAGVPALTVARWLAGAARGARVLHPALRERSRPRDLEARLHRRVGAVRDHPQADARRRRSHAFLDALKLFGIGASWGGFESLAIPFDCKPFRTATPWDPGGPGIRFHIGLEDVDDLIDDLERGFATMRDT